MFFENTRIGLKAYLSNPILKNVFLIFTGTGIAQIIPVIASLFLARIYTKVEFGDLSLLMSISGIIGAISAFRYELVVVLVKKESTAKIVICLALLLIVIVGLFSLIFLFFLFPIIEHKIDISNYSLLYFLPILITGIGICNVFDNWYNRQKEYKKMAYFRMIQSSVTSGSKILLGILGVSWGLIGGTVIGYIAIIMLCLCFYKYEQNKKTIFSYFSLRRMCNIAVEYKDFSIYSTPGTLLNSMSVIGLPILISYFYSLELSGVYFFANNLIRMPISLLSNSVAQVFKKEAVSLVYIGKIKELMALILKSQRIVLFLVLPIILLFSLFGGSLFSLVFGNQWKESGEMIKYFSFYLIFGINFSIISALVDILRYQKIMLIFNFSLLLSQIIIFSFCAFYMRFEYALLINSIIGSLHFIMIDIWIKRKLWKLK